MNEKFITALEEAMGIDCENLLNNLPDADTEFSLKFEKKMNKLIKRRSHSYYPLIATAGRRAACIATAIVIVVAAPLSVKAVRESVKDFFLVNYSDHVSVSVSSIDENAPEIIEEAYTIDIPEGFELAEDFSMANHLNLKYINGDKYINFSQTVLSMFSTDIDNERTTMEVLSIDGVEYQLYNHENGYSYNVIWKNNGYVFDISSNLDRESVIELCKSTKLK